MPQNRHKSGKKGFRGPSPDVGKATQFKPGESPNPGGRPKQDLAADIAKAIFEKNGPVITAAMLKTLKKGNPKVFTALADRAYGKSKEQVDISGRIELVVDL